MKLFFQTETHMCPHDCVGRVSVARLDCIDENSVQTRWVNHFWNKNPIRPQALVQLDPFQFLDQRWTAADFRDPAMKEPMHAKPFLAGSFIGRWLLPRDAHLDILGHPIKLVDFLRSDMLAG